MAAQEEYSETMCDQEEHSETMWDQEESSNNNITNNNTYHVHSQSVQIGDGNKLQTTCETDGNIVYDVEQLKVTVTAQGQKLENQATQLNTQAGQLNAQAAQLNTQASQLNAQAEQLKVHDSLFKQPANPHRIENNCIITLTVHGGYNGGKVGTLRVGNDITVRELRDKLPQELRDVGVMWIYSNKDGLVYEHGSRGGDSTRTLAFLGVGDGDMVVCCC